MAAADFIPAGRTSRIVRGSTELQIQTEYACRPNPRLTTSVFSRGQVIHKIEQELPATITSLEDKLRVEGLLRKQHMEVMGVIESDDFLSSMKVVSEPAAAPKSISQLEVISEIDGVEKILRIDKEGNFESANLTGEFRHKFAAVFKNLRELLEIFQDLPGGKRETGVYAVERHRLYLVSTGHEFYLVLTRKVSGDRNMESELYSAIGH